MRLRRSIRAHLLALELAVALPLLALFGYTLVRDPAEAPGSILPAVIGLSLVFLLAFGLGRRIERPVLALARATRAVREGDHAARATVEGPAEIADVAAGFNEMLDAHAQAEREQLRLQEELRRTEIMSAMGSLVAGVAHEVRNPLFGITATLDAFEAQLGEREEHHTYLVVLRREVNRLNLLMTELLEYGRPRGLDLAPDGAARFIERAIAACESLAEMRGVRIERRFSAGLAPVLVDHERMVQVFQNLVENAVQHSPRGGRVTVLARPAPDDAAAAVELTVSDSGPGFAPADLPHVFEPFFSRRPQGTGLGLAIVKRIVEDHGGSIHAANLPEGGARIAVRLAVAGAR